MVPSDIQPKVLKELHNTNLWICKMKALARSFVWWPHLDKELEALAKSVLLA